VVRVAWFVCVERWRWNGGMKLRISRHVEVGGGAPAAMRSVRPMIRRPGELATEWWYELAAADAN
jgi:hypothetical protein